MRSRRPCDRMVGAALGAGSIASDRPDAPSRLATGPADRDAAGADGDRARPRRVLPARHRRRRPRRDAPARLDGERGPQLVRRLRRSGRGRLPGAGDRPPRPRARPAAARPVPAGRLRRATPPRCCASSTVAPAIVVGYSMGGAIAQLMARDHPDVVGGLVLSGTAQHWQDPETRRAVQGDGRARAAARRRAAGDLGRRLSPRRPAGLAARPPGCCRS